MATERVLRSTGHPLRTMEHDTIADIRSDEGVGVWGRQLLGSSGGWEAIGLAMINDRLQKTKLRETEDYPTQIIPCSDISTDPPPPPPQVTAVPS